MIRNQFIGRIFTVKNQMGIEDKVELVKRIISGKTEAILPKNVNILLPSKIFCKNNIEEEIYYHGVHLLQKGKIAIVMVAGGISSRMGISDLRGNLSIGPITNRTIFQLQAEKLLALQEKYQSDIPIIILTSPSVHNRTIESFENQGFYGISKDNIYFIQQETLPVLDSNLQYVMSKENVIEEHPTGHGGLINALNNSGLLKKLREIGIQHLFYFQYPNVLEQVCDPSMIGFHDFFRSEFTIKTINDYQESEKLGKIIEYNGHLKLIEYYNKDEIKQELWERLPANIGSHVISLDLIERVIDQNIELPYHIIPLHNDRNILKIEQHIFDLMDFTQSVALLSVKRDEEYACVKSLNGINSLQNAKESLNSMYLSWLKEVKILNLNIIKVEISPLFALNLNELKQKSQFEIQNNIVSCA